MKTYKYIVLLSICCLNTIIAQTKSQNYIKSIQYTQPTKQTNPATQQTSQVIYYDGLGRPIQEIAVGVSPSKKSIVKHTEYEVNIGQTKDFLSYPIVSGSEDYSANAKTETLNYYKTPKYENTLNPYSETQYERSPLKKVLKTGAPGEDWKIDGTHTVSYNYRLNRASEVKYKRAKAVLNTVTGIYNVTIEDKKFYDQNTLYVTKITDENGNTVEEFKDQEDRIILKRVYNKTEDMPKLFGMASDSPSANLIPNTQSILGDELKGKSVKDVLDNFETIVNNIEKNTANQVNEFEQKPNNIVSRAITLPKRKGDGEDDDGGDGGGVGPNPGEVKANDSNVFDTYYIYDQYGNLTLITSPLSNGDIDGTAIDLLSYQYRYDTKNRLVAKKLPGKSWEYMVYDKADRLVASGPVYDPFGTEKQGWMVSKYDALSRVVYNGFYSGTSVNEAGRKVFQDNLNSAVLSYEKRATTSTIGGAPVPYTNTVFPKDGLTVLSVNYYDDYTFPNAPSTRPTSVEGQAVISNVKGLGTGSWTRVLTNSNEQKAAISYLLYDYNGRVLKSYTKNYLGGYTDVETKYSFTGLPLKVTTKHQKDTSTPLMTVLEEYVYDHAERLLYQTHKVNGLAEVVLFENVYDELGALEKKRIGGKRSGTTPTASTFLQEAQYKYNIRGWLTEVNNVNNINQVNNGKRYLFAIKLNYNKTEQGLSEIKPMYNGNIAEQIWTSGIDNKKRGYGYAYDGVNRLVLGSFKTPDLNVSSTDTPYNEKLAYDKNGNITRLDRNGAPIGGKVAAIDKLTYGYESGSNRLSTVRDASGNQEGFKQGNTSGADYGYDEFGNLISDKHKKITKIKYNHLNLPVEINFGTDKIEYLYTTSGEKTQKKVTEKGVVTLTDYLGGFQYVKGKLSFLPTAEGFFNTETNAYVYQYKDHLGNVRLSYSDKNNNNTIEASEIIEETNYYPFGLAHKGYNQKNDALMKDYKYQYNAKEKQEELGLNFYDYGARNYDAAIGRWMNVDPLAEQAVNWTPYRYGFNNPLKYIDPTGMLEDDFVFDEKGNFVRIDETDQPDKLVVENSKTGSKQNYWFADPVEDPKSIRQGLINKVEFVSKSSIISMIYGQGGFNSDNSSYMSFYQNSKGNQPFDYTYSVLVSKFKNADRSMFLPEDDFMIHNLSNFGNFLWAATGYSLGFEYMTLKVGAHINSLINAKENGYQPQLDSKDDQESIVKGAFFAQRNNFRLMRK